MEILSPQDYRLVSQLFAPLEFHLAVPAVLAGAAPGEVMVDDAQKPSAGLLRVQHRAYLAGDAGNLAFQSDLSEWFAGKFLPQGLSAGQEAFSLYYAEGWEPAIEETILRGVHPIPGPREYYELARLNVDWRSLVPPDLRLLNAGIDLLDDERLANRADLREEMLSERESVAAFLAHSFGVCLVGEAQIVTWCLSEYNLGNRCEIGIATTAEYRKRGLAAATGAAFIEQAQARGYTRVGWHCWADNLASAATARKIGFERVQQYPSFLVFFDPVFNLAVRGNLSMRAGEFHAAAEWFERAMARGEAEAWVYAAAAGAAARLGEPAQAFALLREAAARGYRDPGRLQENPHLESLRSRPEWVALMAVFSK